MESAFGIEHGTVEKSWGAAEGRVVAAANSLSTKANANQRKARWLSNRKYLASQRHHKGPLKENSPATRAKKEMQVLGAGGSVSEAGAASVGHPAKPAKIKGRVLP